MTEDTTALVTVDDHPMMGLAALSEAQFEARLVTLKLAQTRLERVQRELMTAGEDYGVIPGTKKPTLLKPGAEKLCQIYRLVPLFTETLMEGDGERHPDLRVHSSCRLHVETSDGPIVGEGIGAANSWEVKYRYRSDGGGRACPACAHVGSLRKSTYIDNKVGPEYWYCHAKAGGCGMKFRRDDPAILEQAVSTGKAKNPDPYDAENTLLKMARKRAQIDAVLRATATSGLFTQDVEDLPPPPTVDPLQEPAPVVAPVESDLGITSPPEPITDERIQALPPDAVLITEVAPAFAPMVALLTLHTTEKIPTSSTTIETMARECCRRLSAVLLDFEPLPQGGSKVKRLRRVQAEMTF